MDDIVKKAMAKWPDVPHCYGWLALDARGAWRMRDERAQHLGLAGDKVVQPALLGFINRNYTVDERGCWYFQNGPQRVYLNLEATPYIARTDPVHGLVLHTGEAAGTPARVFFADDGALLFDFDGRIAQLDDRDLAQLMAHMALDGRNADDDALVAWLDGAAGALTLRLGSAVLPVQRLAGGDAAAFFGFVRQPQAPD